MISHLGIKFLKATMKNLILGQPIGTLSFFATSIKKSSSNSPKFLFQISHISTFSPNNAASGTSYPSRRHEEENRNVRVSVWWDFENCNVPAGANVFRVAQCITTAIRANGIKGPIQITAFGDVMQISRLNQEALSSTGINLTHIPRGGKNSADRSLLVDLMYWVSQNPPPAHLFLISGDRDFAGILHRLRMNNYNILLASTESAPSVLCSAASIMWHWNSLLKGESLTGKHFNQPPDGPYGSWYGHYRASLEDPFAIAERPVCARVEDSPDSGSDSKVRQIPKAVVRQIRHILYSYPKGIPITELRAEVSKSNINIDKDFYGYKKFSRFLMAMPQILNLQSESDGQFLVCGVPPKAPEQGEHTPGIITGSIQNGEEHSALTSRLNGEKSSYSQHGEEKPTLSLSSETPMKNAGKQQFFSPEVQKPSPEPKLTSCSEKLPEKEVQEQPQEVQEGVEKAESTESHVVQYNPVSEPGFFKRIWRKWFGHKDGGLKEKVGTASNTISPEKLKFEEKDVKSTIQQVESVSSTPFSPSSNETIIDNNKLKTSVADGDKSKKSFGFLSRILRSWKGSTVSDDISEELKGKRNQIELDSDNNGIFAKESFWDELDAFIDTPEAADIVMQSKTRTQMAQNLQKQGPASMRSLSETDLLHLVNLIISDKKWIEESPSQASPFKLIRSDEKASFGRASSNLCHSNGLSSIFSNTKQPSLLQKPQELDGHKRHQNPPHAGVSLPFTERKPSGKSRNQTVVDCQKLIDELLKEHPEGFNLGSFRKMFLEKYGYPLDMQNLGYQKLATFLQTMPGVSIESTFVFPSHKQKSSSVENIEPFAQKSRFGGREANSESELSDGSGKDDDLDSPWEELGPVSNLGPKKSEIRSGMSRKMKDETREKIRHEYESLSDDNFSDTEEETSSAITSESKKKFRANEADSSLLQILDSWYKTGDDECKQSGSEDTDVIVADSTGNGSKVSSSSADSSGNGSKVSSSSASTVKNETPLMTNGRKQRPSKSYSFVTDQPVHNKDRLIDGILGSLKKAGESSS